MILTDVGPFVEPAPCLGAASTERKPPRDLGSISRPSVSELTLEPWFLRTHHPHLKRHHQYRQVRREERGPEEHRPPRNEGNHVRAGKRETRMELRYLIGVRRLMRKL